jgi:hypothetical protein
VCGAVTPPVSGDSLRSGHTASCGCLRRALSAAKLRRGRRDTPEVSAAAVAAARFRRPCRQCGQDLAARHGEPYGGDDCRPATRARRNNALRRRPADRKEARRAVFLSVGGSLFPSTSKTGLHRLGLCQSGTPCHSL